MKLWITAQKGDETDLLGENKDYFIETDTFDIPFIPNPTVESANKDIDKLKSYFPSNPCDIRTAGIDNVKTLVSGGLLTKTVLYDYEPGYEPEFSTNSTVTAQNFENFGNVCHSAGYEAVGYPAGRGARLWNWNYGLLASYVDVLLVQTQGVAKLNSTDFDRRIHYLIGQFDASAQNISKLGVQATLGTTKNGTDSTEALDCYNVAEAAGIGYFYIGWLTPGDIDSLLEFLEGIGR
jgi:hypothetical protein